MQYRFGGYAIDTERVEIRQGGELISVEPQVFDLLVFLIANRDRVVSRDEILDKIWEGRFVSPSALTTRINSARAAIGDSGKEQRLIKTLSRKGYRFVAEEVEEVPHVAEADGAGTGDFVPLRAAAIADASLDDHALHQNVKFCHSSDGVNIAYARVGRGLPIIKAGNWLNHLEYDWESPVWSHLLRWLASNWELIRYDARGNGLSDWNAEDISFEAFVRDLEAVVEASGVDKCVLFGASQGCAVCIAYAVKHPERVSKLVLYGGFARGRLVRGTPEEKARTEAMLTLMRTGWGQENPAFRQVFTSLFVPEGTPEQVHWFNELQRITTSPENAVRIRRVSDSLDVRELLPQVRVPTLVLHCRDDAVQPFEEGRFIASSIPDARFVGLDGKNHLILETDDCWEKFRAEVAGFLES